MSIRAGTPPTEIGKVFLKNEEGHMDNEGIERGPGYCNGKMAVEDTEES